MIILTHSLAGTALASQTDNIPLAMIVAFASHFLLDAIPHFDQGTIIDPYGRKKTPWPKWLFATLILDIIVTIIFLSKLRHRPDFILLLFAVAASILPDVIEETPVKIRNLPILKQISQFHHKVHYWLPTKKWYLGLTCEVIITGGLVWYFLKYLL